MDSQGRKIVARVPRINGMTLLMIFACGCALAMSLIVVFLLGTSGTTPINLDSFIEELLEQEEGGVLYVPEGTYIAPSINGPNGIIQWGKLD